MSMYMRKLINRNFIIRAYIQRVRQMCYAPLNAKAYNKLYVHDYIAPDFGLHNRIYCLTSYVINLQMELDHPL